MHALMHLLSCHGAVGKDQAGLNVLWLKDRIFIKNLLRSISGSHHSQDMLDGDSHVADYRLPA